MSLTNGKLFGLFSVLLATLQMPAPATALPATTTNLLVSRASPDNIEIKLFRDNGSSKETVIIPLNGGESGSAAITSGVFDNASVGDAPAGTFCSFQLPDGAGADSVGIDLISEIGFSRDIVFQGPADAGSVSCKVNEEAEDDYREEQGEGY